MSKPPVFNYANYEMLKLQYDQLLARNEELQKQCDELVQKLHNMALIANCCNCIHQYDARGVCVDCLVQTPPTKWEPRGADCR